MYLRPRPRRRPLSMGAADPCVGTPGYDPALAAKAKAARQAYGSAGSNLGDIRAAIVAAQRTLAALVAQIPGLQAQQLALQAQLHDNGLGDFNEQGQVIRPSLRTPCADQNLVNSQTGTWIENTTAWLAETAALRPQLAALQAQVATAQATVDALKAWVAQAAGALSSRGIAPTGQALSFIQRYWIWLAGGAAALALLGVLAPPKKRPAPATP